MDHTLSPNLTTDGNVYKIFPNVSLPAVEADPHPVSDEMEALSKELDKRSTFKSNFDWAPIKGLEKRSKSLEMRGGFLFKGSFKLVNSHPTCQQCLYSFEIDTYGRGCIHNCTYCYAKAQLTVHGYWNNPFPAPIDIYSIRKIFHTVFETDKKSKWRDILEKRIPIRIGSMSDSFMWMDDKYKVTIELLKILNHYRYPFVIFTRSDLVAREDYVSLLDKDLCAVQFSISSTNDKLNKMIEPGAPSAKRRLEAIRDLTKHGITTAIRINPVFPIRPDGYFTDPDFPLREKAPQFDYFSFDMVDEMAAYKPTSILAGFGRFSSYSLKQIELASGTDLRSFYRPNLKKSVRDYHFSDKEIRHYYFEIAKRVRRSNIQFSTCYIGNGESHFWKDQDLWSDKKDCCSIKGNVSAFKTSCRDIPFSDRLKHATVKFPDSRLSSGDSSTPTQSERPLFLN
jgi:DNA repair photolyase